jgi:hypothetical protein
MHSLNIPCSHLWPRESSDDDHLAAGDADRCRTVTAMPDIARPPDAKSVAQPGRLTYTWRDVSPGSDESEDDEIEVYFSVEEGELWTNANTAP